MLNLKIRLLDQEWLSDLSDDPVGDFHIQKLNSLRRFLTVAGPEVDKKNVAKDIDDVLALTNDVEDRHTLVEVLGAEMRVVIDKAYAICFTSMRTTNLLDQKYALTKLKTMFESLPKISLAMQKFDSSEVTVDIFVYNQLCGFRNTIAKAVGSVSNIAHGLDCYDLEFAQANLRKQIEVFDLAYSLFEEKIKAVHNQLK